MTPTENCRVFEERIDRELAEGLADGERELLLDHLDACPACSELFDLLRAMRGESVAEPSEHELARMRAAVLKGIGRDRATAARSPRSSARLGGLAAAAAALLLAGGGWLAGRASVGAPRGERVELVDGGSLAPAELARAGYRFSGAEVEEADAGRVRLRFDVARAMEVEVDRGDPLVSEVLVQSLVAPAELGARLRTVANAAERVDPRVRRALVEVMRRDESAAVRLAAQERLLEGGRDPGLVDALIELLEEEESVQMRLAAIDYLTRHDVDAARLERAIEAGAPTGERALLVRAGNYLTGRAPALSDARP